MARQTLESDRQRLLAIERLILETICFNFTSKMPFPFVIKFGRYFNGGSLAASIVLVAPLTILSYSLETIDQVRVASCRRCLPDTRSADVPNSHRSVGVPLPRCTVNNFRTTPTTHLPNLRTRANDFLTIDITADA